MFEGNGKAHAGREEIWVNAAKAFFCVNVLDIYRKFFKRYKAGFSFIRFISVRLVTSVVRHLVQTLLQCGCRDTFSARLFC